MNQFYYIEYGNTNRIMININKIVSIMQIENEILIKTSNGESIKEIFEDSEESEKYLTYITKAIYHGERLISKNLFLDSIKE